MIRSEAATVAEDISTWLYFHSLSPNSRGVPTATPTTPEDQSITVCLSLLFHLLHALRLLIRSHPPLIVPSLYLPSSHSRRLDPRLHLGSHGNWRSGLVFKPFEEVQVRTTTPGHAFAWASLTLCEFLRRLVFLGEQSGMANPQSYRESGKKVTRPGLLTKRAK